jgi:hypothetical protein
MKEIRETIVEENEMCGFENPNLVNVESESRYNNPIYSSGVTSALPTVLCLIPYYSILC